MDENTLDRLEALERDTRVDSLRLDGVRAGADNYKPVRYSKRTG